MDVALNPAWDAVGAVKYPNLVRYHLVGLSIGGTDVVVQSSFSLVRIGPRNSDVGICSEGGSALITPSKISNRSSKTNRFSTKKGAVDRRLFGDGGNWTYYQSCLAVGEAALRIISAAGREFPVRQYR